MHPFDYSGVQRTGEHLARQDKIKFWLSVATGIPYFLGYAESAAFRIAMLRASLSVLTT